MGDPARKIEESGVVELKRNYPVFRFIGGNIISFFGDQIYLIALPLIVLSLTGSALSMGTVAALERIPVLLQPFTGILSDRMNRKYLLLVCDIGRAIIIGIIGALFILGLLQIWHIYSGAFVIGMMSQIYNTAQFATIPSLVNKSDLPAVNAINTGSFNTAIFIAPGLGGIILSFINPGFALLINSFTFVIAGLAVLSIQYQATSVKGSEQSIWKDIGEGFRFVIRKKPILITNLAMLFSVFGTTLFLTMLVFHLKSTIDLDIRQIGTILSAGGAAAICGALISSYLRNTFTYRIILSFSGVFGGMSIVLFGLTDTFIGLLALNAAGTFAASIMSPCIITIRQSLTPDQLLGRVQATSRFMTWSLIPVSAFLSGLLSTYIGTGFTMVIGGLIATIASLIYLHPSMKEI